MSFDLSYSSSFDVAADTPPWPNPIPYGDDYVTPNQVAAQLGYRDLANPRLVEVCTAASDAIDLCLDRVDDQGRLIRFDPVPAMIHEIALALAVDWWKQPDATFGIVGLNETGAVRISRDLIGRYRHDLTPFMFRWGVA
jgi:hypothetical protein